MTTTFVPNDTEEGKMHLYSNAVGPKFHSSLERVHYIHKTQFIIWRPRYFSMQELSVGIWEWPTTSFKRSNYPIKIDDKTSLLLCDKTQKEACKLCWACRDYFLEMLISRLFSRPGKSGREIKFPGNPGNPGKYENGQKIQFFRQKCQLLSTKRPVFVPLVSKNVLLYICKKI